MHLSEATDICRITLKVPTMHINKVEFSVLYMRTLYYGELPRLKTVSTNLGDAAERQTMSSTDRIFVVALLEFPDA